MEANKGVENPKDIEYLKPESWFWWVLVFMVGFLVLTAGILTLFKKVHFFKKYSGHHQEIVEKYSDALGVAIQFFDVQKSGALVEDRIDWRGDSASRDGAEDKLDLSKGVYDAGDSMKFGFPMAFTATVLSWAILEYGDRMSAARQLDYAHDSLKWITDFLVNAHPYADVLYIQVGDPEVDHACWDRPETMTEQRPVTQINTTYPGTDVAAETAAAMASASLAFRKINSSYADLLLLHAEQLFAFADTYRGSYSVSIPQVQKYYNSSGYGDELLWAAAWLYHATRDESYLKYVTETNRPQFANWQSPWFSWDDKHAGVHILMSRVNMFGQEGTSYDTSIALQMYRSTAEEMVCQLLPDSPTATSSRTKGGLIWVYEWNPLQTAVASAFLALLFSDYMVASGSDILYCSGSSYTPRDIRHFAISQADYILGDNPMNMSYLVGFGNNYPQYVHHRGASIPVDASTDCKDGFVWLQSTMANPNVAVGALVGGPFFNETYIDSRTNAKQSEPTTYNSALIVGLISGLVSSSSVTRSYT